jgi:hypothetical protein
MIYAIDVTRSIAMSLHADRELQPSSVWFDTLQSARA